MTDSINRQPQGIPVGGQFAPTTHAEPDVALAPPAPARPVETQRKRRGHDFYPPAEEMAAWPKLYATDGEGLIRDKPIQAHYFQGGMDWYIAEYDPKENEAFGYVNLGHGGEWGYIDLAEVESVRGQMGLPIERDLDFQPGTPAHECIDRYKAEAAEAKKKADEEAADKLAALIGNDAGDEDDRHEIEWPDDEDPMSPEDRKLWDGFHRHAFNYAHDRGLLGCTGFEDRDTIERFAVFAANEYQEADWDGMKDMSGVVEAWMQQERPLDGQA
jgi:hypothetical protein